MSRGGQGRRNPPKGLGRSLDSPNPLLDRPSSLGASSGPPSSATSTSTRGTRSTARQRLLRHSDGTGRSGSGRRRGSPHRRTARKPASATNSPAMGRGPTVATSSGGAAGGAASGATSGGGGGSGANSMEARVKRALRLIRNKEQPSSKAVREEGFRSLAELVAESKTAAFVARIGVVSALRPYLQHESDTTVSMCVFFMEVLSSHAEVRAALQEADLGPCLLGLLSHDNPDIVERTLRCLGNMALYPASCAAFRVMGLLRRIMRMLHRGTPFDALILSRVLLNALAMDRDLREEFVARNGLEYLRKVLLFSDSSSLRRGAVALVAAVASSSSLRLKCVEVGLVAEMVKMIRTERTAALSIKALRMFAKDKRGRDAAEAAGVALMLIEVAETLPLDSITLIMSTIKLMSELSFSDSLLESFAYLGGEEFVSYLCIFLSSHNPAILDPVCTLLKLIATVSYLEVIRDAAKAEAEDNPSPILDDLVETLCSRDSLSRFRSSIKHVLTKSSATVPLAPSPRVSQRSQRGSKLTRSSIMKRTVARRENILKEILTTERNYVLSLFALIKNFMDPMEASVNKPDPLFTKGELTILFSNVRVIYKLHKVLLKQLDKVMARSSSALVGDLFASLCEGLKCYTTYMNNYSSAIELLSSLETKPRFVDMCSDLKSQIGAGALSLESYMIMPIQRVPRYAMLLEELCKNTERNHPDYLSIQLAARKMKDTTEFLDKQGKLVDERLRLQELSSLLYNWQGNLYQPGRRIIMEGSVFQVSKGSSEYRTMVLMSDLLLVATSKKKKLKLIALFRLNQTKVLNLKDGESPFDNSFKILGSNKGQATAELHMWVQEPERKHEWMAAIREGYSAAKTAEIRRRAHQEGRSPNAD